MSRSRFSIGIDLGTTNSILSYRALHGGGPSETLLIPQLTAPGVTTELPRLPSALYFPIEVERESGSLASPLAAQGSYCVGAYALEQSAYLPGRVVLSAKSWLCHGGVDRTNKILPWRSDEVPPSEKLSPIEASAQFLRYVREAWDSRYAEEAPFAEQIVTITVPASFDEIAQQLTLEAARLAAYPANTSLIEEPQAAFYAWLEAHPSADELEGALPRLRDAAQTILVCDVGGGTTDLSLFEIEPRTPGGGESALVNHNIRRLAVSDHVLLGGDNIDRAIARFLEQGLGDEGREITPRQRSYLVAISRGLKERCIEAAEQGQDGDTTVALPAEGSRLIGSTASLAVKGNDIVALVEDGFFPLCNSAEQPKKSSSALREWGLPFAADSRITAYLAQFIGGRRIDAVLFNGGSLKPLRLRERLVKLLGDWQADGAMPIELRNAELELAVSRGAAYYGVMRHRRERIIQGGYARSIYLEISSQGASPQLLCIAPQGLTPGERVVIDQHPLTLLVNQPVRFQVRSSTRRAHDHPGDLVELNQDDFHSLPPLQTVVRALPATGVKIRVEHVPVVLEVGLSELGLLQLALLHKESEERWELHFNLRRDTVSPLQEPARQQRPPASEEQLAEASRLLERYFGKGSRAEEQPKRIFDELERIVGRTRSEWDVALLRALWPPLYKGMTRKGRSVSHEVAWLSLAGYLLRPGYGAALDEWRITELWQLFKLGLAFPKEPRSYIQWWILWRRVAGGLDREQQERIAAAASSRLQKRQPDLPEIVRLLGALERLPVERKAQLGEQLLQPLRQGRGVNTEPYIWALERLGTRIPFAAGLDTVLPPGVIEEWFARLRERDWRTPGLERLTRLFAHVARRTGDRERDVSEETLAAIVAKLRAEGASAEDLRLLSEIVPPDDTDRLALFGEALPAGLVLSPPA